MNNIVKLLPRGTSKIATIRSLPPSRLKEQPEIAEILSEKIQFGGFIYDPDHDCFVTQFEFVDFKQAMCFMNNIAILAEDVNHHPEWFNVYNQVNLVLRTHDCDGLSLKDVFLADAINRVYSLVLDDSRDFRDILVEDWEKFLD
jgi:4a-hydroxytetrahydrobiopterin dehydratase